MIHRSMKVTVRSTREEGGSHVACVYFNAETVCH